MAILTVKELIAHLSQYPPDACVTIQAMSERNDLDLGDIGFVRAEDRELIRHYHKKLRACEPDSYNYISWHENYKKPTDPEPEFVTAVMFPGN